MSKGHRTIPIVRCMYFYVKDCNENILGIIDSTGNLIVKYEYSGFGRCTISEDSDQTIANLNPIRFKGYYYDTESDMNYCQSRYYVPEWGRWLNTDHPSFLDPTSISDLNLFAYCAGAPVNYLDPSGQFIMSLWALFAIAFGEAKGDIVK